jgi:hypothetical protein
MKVLLILPALLLAGTAVAESELKVRVNRIDMAVTAPDETGDTEAAATERQDATNLNSSRSNTSSKAQDYNSSRSNTTALRQQEGNFEGSVHSGGKAQDYNSSRSNNSSSVALDPDDDGDSVDDSVCRNGVDDDCDSPVDEAPANHNTTRSNRTSP